MTARNDVTGDLIISKNNTKAFNDNYEKVFGRKPVKGGSWVYDSTLRRMVVKEKKSENKSAQIRMDLEPFISPIDGTHIKTRKDLESHNKYHGVTNDLDSLKEQAKKSAERQAAPLNKEERIRDMVNAYDYIDHNPHLFNHK